MLGVCDEVLQKVQTWCGELKTSLEAAKCRFAGVVPRSPSHSSKGSLDVRQRLKLWHTFSELSCEAENKTHSLTWLRGPNLIRGPLRGFRTRMATSKNSVSPLCRQHFVFKECCALRMSICQGKMSFKMVKPHSSNNRQGSLWWAFASFKMV